MNDFQKGIRDFQRKLEKIADNARGLDGTHHVPLTEVFPPSFMRSHTDFSSFEGMLQASGFRVESAEDFAAIPDDEWEAFVRARTRFSSWTEMQKVGGAEWAKGKLGL